VTSEPRIGFAIFINPDVLAAISYLVHNHEEREPVSIFGTRRHADRYTFTHPLKLNTWITSVICKRRIRRFQIDKLSQSLMLVCQIHLG